MALSRKDFEKLKRLRVVFDRNYRWWRLVADLLNYAPDILKSEMVDTLCEGTSLTREEAVGALLSQVMGLCPEENAEDRILYREYLLPSVRVYSPDRYAKNPYVREVACADTARGRWEFKTQTYPPYRAAVVGDVEVGEDFSERMPLGFFDGAFSFFSVLEGANEWMTLTPGDVDTCTEAIEAAHGRVVTFGLGLGYFAFMAAAKPEVTSVTVVEKSPEVISMFREHLLPRFPDKDKITIVEADAFEYAESILPQEDFDLAFVDTWRDAGDGLPMYLRMKPLEKKSKNTVFLYWIEEFLLSRLRAQVFEDIWEKESAAAHGAAGDVSFEQIRERLSKNGLKALAEGGYYAEKL